MSRFETVISDPPGRENCVAEIYYDHVQWAEISNENYEYIIEFFAHPKKENWEFNLDEAVSILIEAKEWYKNYFKNYELDQLDDLINSCSTLNDKLCVLMSLKPFSKKPISLKSQFFLISLLEELIKGGHEHIHLEHSWPQKLYAFVIPQLDEKVAKHAERACKTLQTFCKTDPYNAEEYLKPIIELLESRFPEIRKKRP